MHKAGVWVYKIQYLGLVANAGLLAAETSQLSYYSKSPVIYTHKKIYSILEIDMVRGNAVKSLKKQSKSLYYFFFLLSY